MSHEHHEPLQSQINNFVAALYGSVTKTEDETTETVNWTLPCGLDIGLPSNPRGLDEGVACYFLRLMLQAAQANQGPAGEPGAPGIAGLPAFSFTTAPFVTPVSAGGIVTVPSIASSAIEVPMYVFIEESGWYQVLSDDLFGNLTLQLLLPSDVGTVPSGAKIVPVGIPEFGPQGTPGTQGGPGTNGPGGPVGPQGYPGDLTTIHGSVGNNGSVDWIDQGHGHFVPGPSSFPNIDLLLPSQGNFLLIGRVLVYPKAQPPGFPGVAFPTITISDLSNSNNLVPLRVHMEPGNLLPSTPDEVIVFGSCSYYTPTATTIRVSVTGGAAWSAIALYSWILISPVGQLPPSQPP